MTGIPPIDRMMQPNGKKNQVLFMRNPTFMPTALMHNSPTIKSQLLVWGATQMRHLGVGGILTRNFHPTFLRI